MKDQAYAGGWVTKDGYVWADGRDDEADAKKSVYRSNYGLTNNYLDYTDDTSFVANGDFRDGVLYHAGMGLLKKA